MEFTGFLLLSDFCVFCVVYYCCGLGKLFSLSQFVPTQYGYCITG